MSRGSFRDILCDTEAVFKTFVGFQDCPEKNYMSNGSFQDVLKTAFGYIKELS